MRERCHSTRAELNEQCPLQLSVNHGHHHLHEPVRQERHRLRVAARLERSHLPARYAHHHLHVPVRYE